MREPSRSAASWFDWVLAVWLRQPENAFTRLISHANSPSIRPFPALYQRQPEYPVFRLPLVYIATLNTYN